MKEIKIYDISQGIKPGMTFWPGEGAVSTRKTSSIAAGNVCNITRFEMSVHTGTHVDAPLHFIDGGAGMDQLDLNILVGEAQLIALDDSIEVIDAALVARCGIVPGVTRLIFKTRNSKLWYSNPGEFVKGYTGLDDGAAEYLVEHGVKLIGLDYLSVAKFEDTTTPHHRLLGAGVILLEGLDLSGVDAGMYSLYCLPLNIIQSDGAPARAILIKE